MIQQLKNPKVIIAVIVLVLATVVFLYTRPTGPKPVAALAASTALQQGANNLVLSDNQGNLSQIAFPRGVVIIWSGDKNKIPEGWAPCDGKNGTPDLRGKFVWGHNHRDDADPTRWVNDYKTTGGTEQVKIEIANLPKHSHGDIPKAADNCFKGGDCSGERTHVSGTKNSGETGEGKPLDNLPPFYVLIYIMKL